MATVNQAYVFQTGAQPTAAQWNANPQAFVTAFTNIDNTNIGAGGIFASQIIPTSVAQATFGGTQFFTFPKGLIIPGGSTNTGYQLNTASGLGYYGGTGAPSFSAPNGSFYLRYDSATTPLYVNTSGASSTGTTWSGINIAQLAPYAAQAIGNIAYSMTGSETNASPGTIGSVSITLPSSSPTTGWRIYFTAYATWNSTSNPGAATAIGLGSSSAGSSASLQYANTSAAHRISGGNILSDTLLIQAATGYQNIVSYSATYANGATVAFNALLGVNVVNSGTMNGYVTAQAFPS